MKNAVATHQVGGVQMKSVGSIVHIQEGISSQFSQAELSIHSIASDHSMAWLAEHGKDVSVVLVDHRVRLDDNQRLLEAIKYKFPSLPVIVFSTQKLQGIQVFEFPADGYLYAKSSLQHIEAYLRGFLMARGRV